MSVLIQVQPGYGIRQPHAKCLAPLFASVCVQQNVPGDAKNPCPCVLMDARHLIEATPHNKERVSRDVLGMIRMCPPLNESEHVRIDHFVQHSEGVLPVRNTRKMTHALYLSATQPSVSQTAAYTGYEHQNGGIRSAGLAHE
jgi:hypothetical protein